MFQSLGNGLIDSNKLFTIHKIKEIQTKNKKLKICGTNYYSIFKNLAALRN